MLQRTEKCGCGLCCRMGRADMRWPAGKEKRFAGAGPGWDRLFMEKCAKDAKKLAKWKASGYNKRIETHRKKEILMLDIKVIRQDPERVKAAMKSRNKDMDKEIDEILEIDVLRRAIYSEVDYM